MTHVAMLVAFALVIAPLVATDQAFPWKKIIKLHHKIIQSESNNQIKSVSSGGDNVYSGNSVNLQSRTTENREGNSTVHDTTKTFLTSFFIIQGSNTCLVNKIHDQIVVLNKIA